MKCFYFYFFFWGGGGGKGKKILKGQIFLLDTANYICGFYTAIHILEPLCYTSLTVTQHFGATCFLILPLTHTLLPQRGHSNTICRDVHMRDQRFLKQVLIKIALLRKNTLSQNLCNFAPDDMFGEIKEPVE